MPIEHEEPSPPLPPLKKQTPPVVSVEALAAVAQVTLAAGDLPPRSLRHFYERVLGMKFLSGDADALRFDYLRRQVLLVRGAEPGHAAFLVKDFLTLQMRLREHSIAYELIHGDAGMTRMAYLRDPAGNIIQLVETRAL